jgi:GNAT superfamily N-acetyltransferase
MRRVTPAFVLRPVRAAETRPLRQRILRPHQRPEELVFAHDDAAATLHVGAFVAEEMVGTATVHPEAMPGPDGDPRRDWRLRGMATAPPMRRRGVGAALVEACSEHVSSNGGRRVWCNARVGAAPFYAALGFVTVGEPFDMKDIGPHYLMVRALRRAGPAGG